MIMHVRACVRACVCVCVCVCVRVNVYGSGCAREGVCMRVQVEMCAYV